MSLNVTDLVHNERITLDPEDILDCGDTELKTKYYNAIINAMGSYTTKPVALKKLHSLLLVETETQNAETVGKIFAALSKIYTKATEPVCNRILSGQCIALLLKIAVDIGEIQKEMSGNVSTLLSVIVNSDSVDCWMPVLRQVMTLYPGPCGPFKGQIWKKLCGEIGCGRIKPNDLGHLFALSGQLGGGGREGVEHTRTFSNNFGLVATTLNKALNELFANVEMFERFPSSGDVIMLSGGGGGGLVQQTTKLAQILDLLEIECSLITKSFPQVREIDCELILSQVSRLFTLTPDCVLQNDIPSNKMLALVLPSLQTLASQLLQALILSTEEDLIPEVATINNILIKSMHMVSSSKVMESLFKVLNVYVRTLGASTGLQFCMDRILPVFAKYITPQQEKLLLQSHQQKRKGGGKKKKNKTDESLTATNVTTKKFINVKILRAALEALGGIVENIGCLLSAEDFLGVSSMLVNLAVGSQIQDPSCLISLIQNLGSLSSVQNPSFSSPLRLCLHFLQQATKHANQSVGESARAALLQLTPVMHPPCPSLAISHLQPQDMRNIIAKMLKGQEGQEDFETMSNESEDEQEVATPVVQSQVNKSKSVAKTTVLEQTDHKFTKTPSTEKSKPSTTKETRGDSDDSIDENAALIQENLKQIENTKRKRQESEKSLDVVEPKKSKVPTPSQSKTKSADSDLAPKSKSADLKLKSADSAQKSKVAGSSSSKKDNKQEKPEKPVDNSGTAKASENTETSGEELDVETMLKDFSDKLNENLLPDPWDSD
eukprot:TRINITY_DN5790_c0_g1_i11.p1 TRINITY_DN5790_c0_g1~~TRINITY_DN5790_c0_g1_i11.p1  ORF type:complete len:777 (-),score=207.22 TRINITY_DN5790_c0_g1_i11:77-2407(-)